MGNRRKTDRAERRRIARARLRRLGITAARVFLIAGALGAAGGAVYGLHRFATTSPAFAIDSIAVEGNDHATALELRRLAGIAKGDNFFRIDTEAAERRLLEHPWVEEARVRRSFPQGVEISVLEREAAALVDLGHLYLVDRGGEVFKRVVPGDPLDLPVITGLPREAWSARPLGAQEKLAEVLHALEVYEGSKLARDLPPAEIHFDELEGLTLYLGARGLAVKLGFGDLGRKLVRLQRVVAYAKGRGEDLELVRLDNRVRPGWIAARLAEG